MTASDLTSPGVTPPRPPAGAVGDQRHDPLAPVRDALLERARRDADAMLRAADADAAAVLATARDQAAAIHEEARSRGRADAAAVLAAERARGAREARAVVLGARRAAHDALRAAGREAVGTLRDDPGYPAFLDALRRRIAAELGPEAVVTEHPRGGLVGECDGRRVEYTLDCLADTVVDGLGPVIEEAWSS